MRQAISKRTRFNVFKRDRFACQYCGRNPPQVILEPDHIQPVCEGGTSHIDNLVTACFDCNRGKAGISLTVVPQSLAQKAADIKEREAQLSGYREIMQSQTDRIESDMWQVANALVDDAGKKGFRRDWLQSIKTFNSKLDLHEVIDAAEIARASKRSRSEYQLFLYFCGVCWRKIKGDHG